MAEASRRHSCGKAAFEYLGEHPDEFAVLNAGMEATSLQLEAPVWDAYDVSWARTIADVGGGTGAFLAGILERNPQATGILADLEHAAEPARQNLQDWGLTDRCEVKVIDMFEAIPFKADLCTLKRVIHDWPDDKAITILTNCREAMAPAGRIAVIEPVISSLTSAMADVTLMPFGGRERTPDDYEPLFTAAGLKVARIIPVTPIASVVEGTVA